MRLKLISDGFVFDRGEIALFSLMNIEAESVEGKLAGNVANVEGRFVPGEYLMSVTQCHILSSTTGGDLGPVHFDLRFHLTADAVRQDVASIEVANMARLQIVFDGTHEDDPTEHVVGIAMVGKTTESPLRRGQSVAYLVPVGTHTVYVAADPESDRHIEVPPNVEDVGAIRLRPPRPSRQVVAGGRSPVRTAS